jgi:GntR family transcriptional regulator
MTMNEMSAKPGTVAAFLPLYAQVKALMTQRISSGLWKPGEMLPNEFQLAAEFKVSQGTVRKALIALEADKLIVRHQGRGTYVARHTPQQALFQFFRIVDDNGQRLSPTSKPLAQRQQKATKGQALLLGIEAGELVHVITRVRYFGEDPAIFERIVVPVALMPDLLVRRGGEMTDEMYVIYQEQFRVTINSARERLRAVGATHDVARHLDIAEHQPVLEIVRVARDLNGQSVELRISHCKTSAYSYATEVT